MKIGLDIMGGDFAPQATLQGAIEAKKVLTSDIDIVLIGDESLARDWLVNNNVDPAIFSFLSSIIIELLILIYFNYNKNEIIYKKILFD